MATVAPTKNSSGAAIGKNLFHWIPELGVVLDISTNPKKQIVTNRATVLTTPITGEFTPINVVLRAVAAMNSERETSRVGTIRSA